MRVLALDAASVSASVCVTEGEQILYQSSANIGLKHSVTLMPMVKDMLRTIGLSPSVIDLFAVTAGPGSFTGVRIGISAVKGIAWAAGKPCVGVSTLEALACNVHGLYSDDTVVCACMDARRAQAYNALFTCGGALPRRLCADRALPASELARELAGIDARRIVFAGDGAWLCHNEYISTGGGNASVVPEHLINVLASSVARAAEGKPPITAVALAPVYLRLPQAERERLARQC